MKGIIFAINAVLGAKFVKMEMNAKSAIQIQDIGNREFYVQFALLLAKLAFLKHQRNVFHVKTLNMYIKVCAMINAQMELIMDQILNVLNVNSIASHAKTDKIA